MANILISDIENPCGLALALLCKEQGMTVYTACDATECDSGTAFDATACDAGTKGKNDKIITLECDILNENDVKKLAEFFTENPLDMMILSSREMKRMTIENSSHEEFFSIVDKNLKSAFLLTRYVGETMVKRKTGSILYFGSIHSEKPNGGCFAFSCAMGGMKLLCREVTLQFGRQGVRCNYLEAGPIAEDEEILSGPLSTMYDDMAPRFPRRFPCTPEELAKTALSVAENPLLNGSELRADGGFLFAIRDR